MNLWIKFDADVQTTYILQVVCFSSVIVVHALGSSHYLQVRAVKIRKLHALKICPLQQSRTMFLPPLKAVH